MVPTEKIANAKVVLISAVGPLKYGTNLSSVSPRSTFSTFDTFATSLSLNPTDPTPGSNPLQLDNKMYKKNVAKIGKKMRALWLLPAMLCTKLYNPSIISSTKL